MINSLYLKNWKIHSEKDFTFSPGINVLVGNMGSGKSSILQAISFSLFGTFMELKKRDVTQQEIITRNSGASFAEAKIKISSGKEKYIIQRKINEKGTNEAVARTSEGKLIAGPNPTSANLFVENFLKANDEIFFRTAYCVQNNIDAIVKYSPKERKEKTDELMGLDKFDKARNNCIKLRNQLLKRKAEFEKIVSELNIEEIKKEHDELIKEKEAIKSQEVSLKSGLEKLKEREKMILKSHSRLREKADFVQKKSERKELLEEELGRISEKLAGASFDKSKEEFLKELNKVKESIPEKNKLIESLEIEKESKNQQLLEIEREQIELESKKKDLAEKMDNIKELKEKILEYNIKDLNAELEETKARRKEIEKQFNSLSVKISEEKNHLVELEKADSLCPTCSRELSEMTKNELISEKKRAISENLQQQSQIKDELSQLEKREEMLEKIFKENREGLEDISKEEFYKDELMKIHLKIEEIISKKNSLKSEFESTAKKRQDLKQEIETLNGKREYLIEKIRLFELKDREIEVNKNLQELEEILREKNDILSNLAAAEREKEKTANEIQEAKTRLEGFENLISEKEKRISNLERELSQNEKYLGEIKALERQTKFLEEFRVALSETQKSLRDELILTVNEMMDSIWSQLYPYEKWQSVRLFVDENDYILQMKNLDGDWLKVSGYASGGEKMLAALAVRIAFSRVLAPNLGLLILDEPTHNLDDKAVETLVEIIKTRLSDIIEQVFVVTHDERLAEAGNNIIRL